MPVMPGNGGKPGNAAGLSYRERTLKTHERYIGRRSIRYIELPLKDLETKSEELVSSHLTVMAMGHFLRHRKAQDFQEQDANLMLDRMKEFKKSIVTINSNGSVQ